MHPLITKKEVKEYLKATDGMFNYSRSEIINNNKLDLIIKNILLGFKCIKNKDVNTIVSKSRSNFIELRTYLEGSRVFTVSKIELYNDIILITSRLTDLFEEYNLR